MKPWPAILALSLAACSSAAGPADGGDAGIAGGPCTTPEAAAACSSAADNLNTCCQGTILELFDGPTVCSMFAPDSSDPTPICQALATPDCADLHAQLLTQDLCCCAPLQRCDPQQNGACAMVCARQSDCTDPARPVCPPIAQELGGAIVIAGVHICKPDDGQPYHGCGTSGCADGFDCASDAAGNQFCSQNCPTGDVACGDQGIACCNASGSMGEPACGVCDQP